MSRADEDSRGRGAAGELCLGADPPPHRRGHHAADLGEHSLRAVATPNPRRRARGGWKGPSASGGRARRCVAPPDFRPDDSRRLPPGPRAPVSRATVASQEPRRGRGWTWGPGRGCRELLVSGRGDGSRRSGTVDETVTRDEDVLREFSEATDALLEAREEWHRTGAAPPDYDQRIERWERTYRAAEPVIDETLSTRPASSGSRSRRSSARERPAARTTRPTSSSRRSKSASGERISAKGFVRSSSDRHPPRRPDHPTEGASIPDRGMASPTWGR